MEAFPKSIISLLHQIVKATIQLICHSVGNDRRLHKYCITNVLNLRCKSNCRGSCQDGRQRSRVSQMWCMVALRELSFLPGRQFFLVPPPLHAQKILVPPWHAQNILVTPFAYTKRFWSPHGITTPHINNEKLRSLSWKKNLVPPL